MERLVGSDNCGCNSCGGRGGCDAPKPCPGCACARTSCVWPAYSSASGYRLSAAPCACPGRPVPAPAEHCGGSDFARVPLYRVWTPAVRQPQPPRHAVRQVQPALLLLARQRSRWALLHCVQAQALLQRIHPLQRHSYLPCETMSWLVSGGFDFSDQGVNHHVSSCSSLRQHAEEWDAALRHHA